MKGTYRRGPIPRHRIHYSDGMAEAVRHVRRTELIEADPTPGMRRRQAILSEGLWAGLVETEPGMVSGWHHHGEHETSIYIASGALRMEYGPGGASLIDAVPGDFIHVPPRAIHREANPGREMATIVVVRAGGGVPTVNVDGPEEISVPQTGAST
jgi:uncharacterized RmlC-like cupin family protein